MPKSNAYYMEIAGKLKELLAGCAHHLSKTNFDLITEFIDVAEYGLALETLADVVENEIRNDDTLRKKLLELVGILQIRSNEMISRFEKGNEV